MSGICERLGAKFPGPTRLIVFREADLSRHLRRFVDYYHRSRTHLGLEKDTPEPRPSKDGKPGVSSRSQRWADSIIGTNVALPKSRAPISN